MAQQAHRRTVHHGERGRLAGRDGGGGDGAAVGALEEGPKPRGEQRGLLRGVVVGSGGGLDRGPDSAHALDDGVALGAVRE